MRRSPEFRRPAAVLGRDGRVEPFDAARLAGSLRRALPGSADDRLGSRALAEDLAKVVELFLSRSEQGPLVGQQELIELGCRLLLEEGQAQAAQIHRARPRRARSGRPRDSHEALELPVAALLSEGAPGGASDRRLAGLLLAKHALCHVLPGDALAAQQDGRIDFRPWLVGARLVEAVLPRGWLTRLGGGRSPRSAVLGAALRPLVGLVHEDLILPWDGALPGRRAAQDLGHQLVPSDSSAGRLVLSLSAERALHSAEALGNGLLAALRSVPGAHWALRIHGPCDDPAALARLTQACGRVEVSRAAPPGGCLRGAARVDLAALARAAGPVQPGVFLQGVSEALRLALRGLSAWADSEPVSAAWAAMAPSLGDGVRQRLRVELAGWVEARRLLLGDGARARANGDDLAAALGDRLASEQRLANPRELMLVASAGSSEDAAEIGRLAQRLHLCPGAALPVALRSEEFYRSLLGKPPTLAGSGSCA